jgi:PEP-CTERM motif
MKFGKTLFASIALAASLGAQAQVTGALGGGAGTFLLLSSPAACVLPGDCSLTGSVNASIVGGTILNADQPFADIPKGAIAGYISFLWGSPDLYNSLTVMTTAGNFAFTAAGLGFSVTNGDQSFSQYVQFTADAGVDILGLAFTNSPKINAFEVANFSVTAPVPEPETYVLMLAGLGAVGFMSRRRRRA